MPAATISTGIDPAAALRRPQPADLETMLMIRHFECALLNLYERGLLSGTVHTCLGQEYVPVAMEPLLGGDDFVFSNHRGHGHYLARYDDPEGLLAEIMGREGAVCAGPARRDGWSGDPRAMRAAVGANRDAGSSVRVVR